MTVDDIKQALGKYNFQHHYDDVEHWDRYTNKSYPVSIDNKVYNLFLEVSINYYNVQIIWYNTGWNKCTKIYYIHREIQQFETFENLVESFIKYCTDMYPVKLSDYVPQDSDVERIDETKHETSLLEFVKTKKQTCYVVVPNAIMRFNTKMTEAEAEARHLSDYCRPLTVNITSQKLILAPCELRDACSFLITDDVLEDVLIRYAYDERGIESHEEALRMVINIKSSLIGKACLPVSDADFFEDNVILLDVSPDISNQFPKSQTDTILIDGHSLRYKQQLKDDRWLAFRKFVLLTRGRKCEICGSQLSLQIHHPKYIEGRCAWEYTCNEVKVLCQKCHKKIHNIK